MLKTDTKIIAINLLKSHHPERNKFTEHDLDFIKKVIADTIPQAAPVAPVAPAAEGTTWRKLKDTITVLLFRRWPKGGAVSIRSTPDDAYKGDEWFKHAVDDLTQGLYPMVSESPEYIKPHEWAEQNRIASEEGLYLDLNQVLERAFNQAAGGKGKERHAQGKPFNEQPMQVISDLIGSQDGLYYQAIKKIQEAKRLPSKERQVAELLGAIVYIAGAVINLEKSE